MSESADRAPAWDVTTEAGVRACYDATLGEVYRYAVRLAGSRAGGEDLTQETFMRLVRAARSGGLTSIGVGWLITTLRRLHIDGQRSAGSERDRLRLLASDPVPEPLNGSSSAEMLAGLSDRERAALVFRYIDDLPVPEVAALLGTSVRAAESLLQRAKRKARGDLG